MPPSRATAFPPLTSTEVDTLILFVSENPSPAVRFAFDGFIAALERHETPRRSSSSSSSSTPPPGDDTDSDSDSDSYDTLTKEEARVWAAVVYHGVWNHYGYTYAEFNTAFSPPPRDRFNAHFKEKLQSLWRVLGQWGDTFFVDLAARGIELPPDPSKSFLARLATVAATEEFSIDQFATEYKALPASSDGRQRAGKQRAGGLLITSDLDRFLAHARAVGARSTAARKHYAAPPIPPAPKRRRATPSAPSPAQVEQPRCNRSPELTDHSDEQEDDLSDISSVIGPSTHVIFQSENDSLDDDCTPQFDDDIDDTNWQINDDFDDPSPEFDDGIDDFGPQFENEVDHLNQHHLSMALLTEPIKKTLDMLPKASGSLRQACQSSALATSNHEVAVTALAKLCERIRKEFKISPTADSISHAIAYLESETD